VHGDMHCGESCDRPHIPFRAIAGGVQPNAKIHAITFSFKDSAARNTSKRFKNFVRRGCHFRLVPVVAPAQLTREKGGLNGSFIFNNFNAL
jgi:hypothetical protein